jgi:hypothetical protein
VKVVRTDNYDDEGPRGNQHVVDAGLSLDQAESLCQRLNEDPRRSEFDWYVVKDEDYVPWIFKP